MEAETSSEGFSGKASARLINGLVDLEKITRDNGIDPEAFPIVGFSLFAGKRRFMVNLICNDLANSDGQQRSTVTKEASYSSEEFFELFGNFSVTVLSNSAIRD